MYITMDFGFLLVLILFSLIIIVSILNYFRGKIINLFSKNKYRNCEDCEYFKFYSTWSYGDGADYKCNKKDDIFSVENLTNPHRKVRCQYFKKKEQ